MKELSIEQKAKAYDEAIERAKDFMNGKVHYALKKGENIMCWIFPELRESEDEMIRKAMIHFFFNTENTSFEYWEGIPKSKVIAWLEKQGEQNHADKVEPKFKVGDEIKTKNEESLIITRIDRWGYWSEDLFICNFNDTDKWELVEQKPAEWSEEDENMLQSILDEYKSMLTEKRNWLKNLKGRVQPQPKQEWSEEDDSHICNIINWLDVCKAYNQDAKSIKLISQHIAWLKSLRPQWKPSDKQIKGIECAIKTLQHQLNVGDKRLNSLYNDLKKLREE